MSHSTSSPGFMEDCLFFFKKTNMCANWPRSKLRIQFEADIARWEEPRCNNRNKAWHQDIPHKPISRRLKSCIPQPTPSECQVKATRVMLCLSMMIWMSMTMSCWMSWMKCGEERMRTLHLYLSTFLALRPMPSPTSMKEDAVCASLRGK